jgi:hypothetical protein
VKNAVQCAKKRNRWMNFKTQSMRKTESIANAENAEMKRSEKSGKNMRLTHCDFRFWA